jgi:hypothetical protein
MHKPSRLAHEINCTSMLRYRKLKLSLCLINRHPIKMYRGVKAPRFLNLGTRKMYQLLYVYIVVELWTNISQLCHVQKKNCWFGSLRNRSWVLLGVLVITERCTFEWPVEPWFYLTTLFELHRMNEYKIRSRDLFLRSSLGCAWKGYTKLDPHFLDLSTSWRWVVSFTPRPLYTRERAPGTHCIGGWVDPRAGLDNIEKWKFWPYRDSNPELSVVQPVASRYTDCAIPAR